MGQDDDNHPLLEDEDGNHINPAPGEYVEKQKCCGCIPLRWAIHIFSLLIQILFILLVIAFVTLCLNETFDTYYKVVYGFLIVPVFFAMALFCVHDCCLSVPFTRALLPPALILVIVDCFLLILWIFIYVAFCYGNGNYVKVKRLQFMYDDDDDHPKYVNQSKAVYIFLEILWPLGLGITFIFAYFITKSWVERHRN